MAFPLQVVAATVIGDQRLLLVSKLQAPQVFYLPGGKPEPGEQPLDTLARELAEELGVAVVDAEPLCVVSDEAALERTAMEMQVYLARIEGMISPQAEIARIAWVDASGRCPGSLAPAIANHVLPYLVERQLVSAGSDGAAAPNGASRANPLSGLGESSTAPHLSA
jgi:8-oxo-dGTP diphosphatase